MNEIDALAEEIYNSCGEPELSTQRMLKLWEMSPNWQRHWRSIARYYMKRMGNMGKEAQTRQIRRIIKENFGILASKIPTNNTANQIWEECIDEVNKKSYPSTDHTGGESSIEPKHNTVTSANEFETL